MPNKSLDASGISELLIDNLSVTWLTAAASTQPLSGDPMLLEPTQQSYAIDLNEPRFHSLACIANRMAALLETSVASSNTELFSTLDDFLGAAYALTFAHRGGFKERRDQTPELEPPRKRARQLEQGHVRTDGVWMAGFHFNSALYRIAAVYHRVLKLAASDSALRKRKRPMVDDLLPDVEPRFPNWKHDHLTAVHNEVNLLKHERGGIYATRRVSFDDAVLAAQELLDLLEAWIGGTAKQSNAASAETAG